MARLNGISFLALFAAAAAVEVTPIEKVISLIQGMADAADKDMKAEAKTYNTFACFCKDTTAKKSKSVQKGQENINLLSSNIADKTQAKKADITELSTRQGKQEKFQADLAATTARCAKQKAEYEAQAADLSKAIQGLKDAIKSMSDSKPKASFIAIKQTLGNTLAMAEAMNLVKAPKRKAAVSFLQSSVDPKDPEFKFHSDEIISLCQDLLKEYKANKKTVDEDWGKTKKSCDATKASLRKSISANSDAMKQLKKDMSRLGKEIAKHREDLVSAESLLKDDDLYLKDLTQRCSDRANDFDQRSAMMQNELTALNSALKILRKSVKGAADSANKRAMFVQKPSVAAKVTEEAPALKAVSFLQEVAASVESSSSFLGLSQEAKKGKALDVLRKEGKRIKSVMLTSLAENAAADPFKKIKGLIQKLIERLLAESSNEATKKGFCDTELAKARKERDFRMSDATDLNGELQKLEATRDSLKAEISKLKKDIKDESKALKDTTAAREQEKKDNLETMKTAKGGLAAVNEAILVLKTFYKQASKAAFVQGKASPVDEDAPAVASGSYKGNQSGSQAIFALLETIASDFDRTLRKTEKSENAAHREFVSFTQASQSSIAGKKTKKALDEEDLKTTLTAMATGMDDLQTASNLLDSALKTLEDLKPTCIDTGMSYKERVKKREEEMKALQKAHDILLP